MFNCAIHVFIIHSKHIYYLKNESKLNDVLSYCICVLQRAKEEAAQKEVKVKLLTDSVNNFIARAPPAAHEALKKELDVLITNYQRLCSRLNGKCKTLEVSYFVSL